MAIVSSIPASPDLKQSVTAALEPLGGIGRFVHPGDSVFLKPNFNSADPSPASSDVRFLQAAIEVVAEQKPGRIILGESSAFYSSASQIMARMGVYELENLTTKLEILNLNNLDWTEKRNPQARYLKKVRMPKILDEVDRLILLPCLKTHRFAQFTGSLKISVAFMRPAERLSLHARFLQEKIAELNCHVHPDLVIMDARKCFITGGPQSGEVREPNLILSSTDRVAIDVEGIKIIQSYPSNTLADMDPLDLPQIKLAMDLGIGQPMAQGEASHQQTAAQAR